MSFCNCSTSDKVPGNIVGNPLYGLCEKALIQVNRVFDACMTQQSNEQVTLPLTAQSGSISANKPLTLISAVSSSSKGVLSGVTVTPLQDRQGCSRVQATVTIPIEVIYADSTGATYKATSSYAQSLDVVLNVPDNSVIPVELDSTVTFVALNGTYQDTDTFVVTACSTIILKVVAEVELLIPTYGYPQIPSCQPYSQEVCAGVFDLPLFPSSNNFGCNNN